VNRLWQLHHLKPHLSDTFKLSRDAKFLEKLTDVAETQYDPENESLDIVFRDGTTAEVRVRP
jgi:hypothetical protein